ncbi:hypothetical protein FRC11_006764, partial [Ceratobasidium sp. 423]
MNQVRYMDCIGIRNLDDGAFGKRQVDGQWRREERLKLRTPTSRHKGLLRKAKATQS